MKAFYLRFLILFFLLLTKKGVSQELTFTWVSGSNQIKQNSNYGSMGVPSSSNVPGARYSSASWSDLNGDLWLFGGYGEGANNIEGNLNDLWKFNTITGQWTWVGGSNESRNKGSFGVKGVEIKSNLPSSRKMSGTWVDSNGHLWLFGGESEIGMANDLWKYNLTDNSWTWIGGSDLGNQVGNYGVKGLANPTNQPGSRRNFGSVTDSEGNFWLFGGVGFDESGGNDFLNDLWKYDPIHNSWTWVSGSKVSRQVGVYGSKGVPSNLNVPGARESAAVWFDGLGNIFLFGGSGIDSQGQLNRLNDFWKFNLQDGIWTWLGGSQLGENIGSFGSIGMPSTDNIPSARKPSNYWVDNNTGKLWLFGGEVNTGGSKNDLWSYDPTTNFWTWCAGSQTAGEAGIYGQKGVSNSENIPGSRSLSNSFSGKSLDLWIFGGGGFDQNKAGGLLNDLWKVTVPNNAPTNINISVRIVSENLPIRTTVSTLSTTDSDGGSFTYSLVSGEGSTDNASFTIDGSTLKTAAVFNAKTKSSYNIRVRTTDSGGLFFEKAFTIYVLPSYLPADGLVGWWPFNGDARDESGNGNDGVIFGATLNTDRFGFQEKAFSFDGVDDYISCASKVLPINNSARTFSAFLNFQPIENISDWSCILSYGTNQLSSNPGFLNDVLIGTDQKDKIYINFHEAGTISESRPNLIETWNHITVVYDGKNLSEVKVYINGVQIQASQFNSFGINSLVTELSTLYFGKATIPYRSNSYFFKGSIDDIAIYNRALSVSEIQQLYQPTNSAPVNITISSSSIKEASTTGSIVGNFSTTDSPGEVFTYSLISGEGSTDNPSFTIDGSILKTAAVFNAKTKSSYNIRVRTTDSGGLFFEKAFTIYVLPSNLPADGLVGWWPFNGNANDESGNNLNGVINGPTLTTDRDGKQASAFNFDVTKWSWGTGGDHIYIPYNSLLNTPNITVSAWFRRNTNGVMNQSMTVINRFENGYSNPNGQTWIMSLDQNTQYLMDTWVFQGASDNNQPRIINNGPFIDINTWYNVVFTFDGTSIKQYVNGILTDTDALAGFTLNTAGNSGISIGLSKQANGTWSPFGGIVDDIAIWNRALNANEILAIGAFNNSPTNISLTSSSVLENQTVGTTVGTLATSDLEGGQMNYTLVSGTGSEDNNSFTIEGADLKTAASFDFETKASYSIRIRTTDSGGLFFEKQFIISISNVDEPPINLSLSNQSIPEKQPIGTIIGSFSTTDPENGGVTYALVTGEGSSGNSAFQVDGSILKTNFIFDRKVLGSYSIRIRATDVGGKFTEKAFVIYVIPSYLPSNSLMAWWPLDGDGKDYSGMGLDGVNNGGVPVSDRFNNPNSALSFYNNSTGIFVPAIKKSVKDRSFTSWVYVADVNNLGGAIVNLQSTAIDFDAIVYNEANRGWGFSADYNKRTSWSDQKEFAQHWVFIAATYTDNDFKLYRNGELIYQTTQFVPLTYDANTLLLIGLRSCCHNLLYFPGKVDDVGFWDRVLSEAEVKNIFDGSKPANLPPSNILLSNARISENSAPGQFVGKLTSKDSETGSFVYSLVQGDGATDNSSFLIKNDSLFTKFVGEYARKSTYKIRIQSTDVGGLAMEKAFEVYILPQYIPSSGLVAWLPFNGNTTDESGNGNQPYLNNVTLSKDRFDQDGRAYSFSGTNSNMNVYPISTSLQERTFSAWVYLENVNQQGGGVLSLENFGTSVDAVAYNYAAQGWGFGGDSRIALSGVKETENKWVHIVAVYKDFDMRLYRNGVQILKTVQFPILNYSKLTNLLIGLRSSCCDPNGVWNGKLDDLAIWNRALSESEISNLYTLSNSPLAVSPVAQPTGLNFITRTASSIGGSFTPPSIAPSGGYLIQIKAGSEPSGIPVDGFGYTVGYPVGDGLVAYTGIDPTFTITNLTENTNYFLKIFSYNINGIVNSYNYLETLPLSGSASTLASEPSASPTSLSFSGISTSGFTLNFNAGVGTGLNYLVVRRPNSTLSSDPVDGTTYTVGSALGNGTVVGITTSLTFTETGLTAGTTYYYSIFAFRGSGPSVNYLVSNPLTGDQRVPRDITAPVFGANSTPVEVVAGTAVTVSLVITDAETSVTSVKLSYGPAGSSTFKVSDATMTAGSGNSYTFSIPGGEAADPGIRYKVSATNEEGLNKTDFYSVGITYAGDGLPIPYTISGTTIDAYAIISIPLKLTANSVNAVFGPVYGPYGDKEKWRMFQYQNGTNVELNGNSQLQLGKGYWLISAQAATLKTGPGSTNGSADKPVTVQLNNGWNQIGNPYTYRIGWQDILNEPANSGVTFQNTLRIFTAGSFTNGTGLNAFQGGFVFVNSGNKLTYPAGSTGGRISESREAENLHTNSSTGWIIPMEVSNARRKSRNAGIGMMQDGSEQFDRYDDFTLPRMPEYLELNHNKTLHRANFSLDVVPFAETREWKFRVESSDPGTWHRLTWQKAEFISNDKSLVLWDVRKARPIDMKKTEEYIFRAPADLSVFFGDEDYIREQSISGGFVMHDPSPNPSEGLLTISFLVPEHLGGEQVAIQVLDQQGHYVGKSVTRKFESGYHEVELNLHSDTAPVPNGLYLVRCTIGAISEARKVMIKR